VGWDGMAPVTRAQLELDGLNWVVGDAYAWRAGGGMDSCVEGFNGCAMQLNPYDHRT